MAAELVGVEIEDGVACLTLANPPLNLVSLELTRELSNILDQIGRAHV